MSAASPPQWPATVKTCRAQREPSINLTRLAREHRQAWGQIWRIIRDERPALAELLRAQWIPGALDAFGAQVVVALSELPEGAWEILRGCSDLVSRGDQ